MTTSALDLYFGRIASGALLTRSEERAVARTARLGREAASRREAGESLEGDDRLVRRGRRAHAELFERNLKLVVSIAKRYPGHTRLELIDLIQEGNLGLDHAITKFDERRGFKLSTYATNWIMNYITRLCDRNAAVPTIPANTVATLRLGLRHDTSDGVFLEPDLQRAAAALEDHSLDAPLSTHTGGGHRHDYLADTGQAAVESTALRTIESQRIVEEVMTALDEQAHRAVVHRFGLDGGAPMSLDGVAQQLGVSAKVAKRLLVESLQPVIERHATTIDDAGTA